MEKITKVLFKCQYCGLEHEDENFMGTHEECCAKNPKNQPCITCANLILNMGCSKNVDMESVGGNSLCFCYKEGIPQQNPFLTFFPVNPNPLKGE